MYYFLDPFGCVKNQVDAENMMACLNRAGWQSTPAAEDADIIIINSCGFIKSAKQESIDAVLQWRKLYPNKKILLAGCLAQRYEKELKDSLPEVDGFFGVTHIANITEAVDLLLKPSRRSAEAQRENLGKDFKGEGHTEEELNYGNRPLLSMAGSAYVKISEGCDNNCSYCAIPLIRGNLKSRSILDIIEECKTLIGRGIKELNIIGQDIGSFGVDTQKTPPSALCSQSLLPELLNAISKLDGNFWIRLLYIHPDHFPLEIIGIMKKDPRILPYFDIPFQHASSKIIGAMNRLGCAEQYLELLNKIRSRLPQAVIRSTFLLGFPGETEEDFAQLLDFQQKAKLDWLGCFIYSREEGTAAFSMKGRVPAKTAQMRRQLIEERQVPITEKNMERFAGRTMKVLLEEYIAGERKNAGGGFWLGRLYCQAPDIDGAAVIADTDNQILQIGEFVLCRVLARRGFDLEAETASPMEIV